MSDRCTTHSHPICPTCQSDLSGRKELAYLARDASAPLANDDVANLYEETSRLVHFLGALAQAGPYAAAQDCEAMNSEPPPDWLRWYGEVVLPAARGNPLLMEEASKTGREFAERGWEDIGELAALGADTYANAHHLPFAD